MFGEKEFKQLGYPTPEETPEETTCLLLQIPANSAWWSIWTGLLLSLTEEANWQQFEGGMTPEDAADAASITVENALALAETQSCGVMVETPFWDDEEDVDDEATAEDQMWYGEVTNPTAPAGELDFVENILLWAFTGLVAVATFEIGGPAPAIAFHTFVEKFIIIQKRGDAGETIRFVIDHEDAITIDTTPYAPGELIETTLVTPQTGMEHELMIIGGSS